VKIAAQCQASARDGAQPGLERRQEQPRAEPELGSDKPLNPASLCTRYTNGGRAYYEGPTESMLEEPEEGVQEEIEEDDDGGPYRRPTVRAAMRTLRVLTRKRCR